MTQIDELGHMLCRFQAKLFVDSIAKTPYSSDVFLERFMNSAVAKRMDIGSILYEATSNELLFDEIDEEFGIAEYGEDKYDEEQMYWMGYLYRYWCITYRRSSMCVYGVIKPSELRRLYFPYHSLDTAAAIDRILEAKKRRDEDMITEGVKILRKIRNAKQD